MKKLVSIFCLLLVFSCDEKKDNVRYLSASSGNINSISVVADNLLWEDKVGEAKTLRVHSMLFERIRLDL